VTNTPARSPATRISITATGLAALAAILRTSFILPLFQEVPLNAGYPDEHSRGYHVILDTGAWVTIRWDQVTLQKIVSS